MCFRCPGPPVEDAREPYRKIRWSASGLTRRVPGRSPERDRLELAFRDDDWQGWILQKVWIHANWYVKHVATPGRRHVAQAVFAISFGIEFNFRVIATYAILPQGATDRVEIGNDDSRVIARFTLATNDFGTLRGHHATQHCAIGVLT